MNSFGLGLVLNFVDNASAGMTSATSAFNNMSATADALASSVQSSSAEIASIAYSLSAVGDAMSSVGSSIVSTFTGVTQTIINTGMSMQGYTMQLTALYGTSDLADAKMREIQEYAAKSVFSVESLIPAVTMMKTVGIEAMDDVTTSSGKNTQKLMDYASDIAAMVPNMHNAYGVGVSAAMGAIKEYVAEGNAMSLKRGASLDITSLLGEEKGSNIEERTRQIADLVEKLNIVGYTASLAGTPTQRLSNLQDHLFNTLSKIANSGIFETYCNLLEELSNWVDSLISDTDTYDALVQLVSDTVTELLTPVTKLLNLVMEYGDNIVEWIKNHQELTKRILKVTVAVGAFLLVGGKALKFLSTFAFALNGLMGLKALPTMIARLGGSFGGLISRMLPLISLAGILYFVWKENIFGIREVFSKAFGDITTIIKLVKDAWSDFTLTEENYDLAQRLGLLPFIESLLQIKYYSQYVFEGFKQGFKSFFEGIKNALSKLSIFGIDINGITSKLGDFLKSLVGIGQEDKWKNIGEIAGKFGGLALAIFAVVNVLKLLRPVTNVLGGLKNVPIFKTLGIGGSTTTSKSLNPLNTLKSFTSLAIIVGGFSLVVIAFSTLARIPGFSQFISGGIDLMSRMFTGILPIVGGIAIVSLLVIALSKLGVSATQAVKGIADLAIIILGFELIVTAVGAIASIPYFNSFISSGADTMLQLLRTMSVFGTPDFLILSATIAGFGLLTPATIALGVAGLAIIVLGMGLIVSAFGGLAQIPGFNDFLKDGGDTLALLFEQVGKAVGSLVGGVLTGITSGLPEIADNLVAFSDKIKPFFMNLADCSQSDIGGFLDSFSSFAIRMGANEVLSFFTGDIDLQGLAVALCSFSKDVRPFFDEVATFNETGLLKAPLVFQSLSGIGDIDFKMGGIAQLFMGSTSIDNIGQQLASFAPNGATFFSAVAEYSQDGLDKAPSVFEALSGIGNVDFKMGGMVQLFMGSTSFDNIGNQLASFAPNGTTFFSAVSGYSMYGMQKTPYVFEALSGIGNVDFKMGGMIQLFTGSTSFDNIGNQLASFAPNGAKFFNDVATYSNEGIRKAPLVFTAISKAGNIQFRSGGFIEFISGSSDLENFGKQLVALSPQLVSFFGIMSNISLSSIDKGEQAIQAVSSLGSISFRSDGLLQTLIGETDLSVMGKNLPIFGKSMASFFDACKLITLDSTVKGGLAINALKNLGSVSFREGGMLQALMGGVNLTAIGVSLSGFADGAVDFFTKSGTIKDEQFIQGTKLINSLSTIDTLLEASNSVQGTNLADSGTQLSQFIANAKVFFDFCNGNDSVENIPNVVNQLESVFDLFDSEVSSSMQEVSNAVGMCTDSVFLFANVLGSSSVIINSSASTIKDSISNMVNSCSTILDSFANKGLSIGNKLMMSIAQGINNSASAVASALKRTVGSITVNIPTASVNLGSNPLSNSILGLDTGGYVKTEGMALLHPNEVVVNDSITKGLQEFLQQNKVVNADLQTTHYDAGIPNLSNNMLNTSTNSGQNAHSTTNDYSVNFEQGSIVIQANSSSEADLNNMADKLMNIINRKLELRAMAVRN